MDVRRVQRRTLTVLFGTQMVGGVGVAIGISVAALLAAGMAGTRMSGLASSAVFVGGALLAAPATRLTRAYGRRCGMAFGYLVGALGATVVVVATATGSVPLLFGGALLFGGGATANLQARYAAVDLAEPRLRGRQLSLVVWATTIGAVAGPNLAPPADRYLRGLGQAEYAGPFAFSAVAFLISAVAITLLMRPDPLLVAARLAAAPAVPAPPISGAPAQPISGAPAQPRDAPPVPVGRTANLRQALGVVRTNPAARLGIAAVVTGHLVMVGVMSMTPIHIRGYTHEHADVLRIVGIVLSLHIAGMYAFSPAVGWLTDRFGRRGVIVGGVGGLMTACAVAGTAGHRTVPLSAGLLLLGLGWSGTMVAGSTLLSESVPAWARPSVQGFADLVMGLAGAVAGALSGPVVEWFGYPTLALLAAIAAVPLLALALRPPLAGVHPVVAGPATPAEPAAVGEVI